MKISRVRLNVPYLFLFNLIEAVTINVTEFFRNPETFEVHASY
jgi:chemotaxis methyl-accepting protein methylase